MNGDAIQKIFAGPTVIVHSEDVQERRFPGAGRSHDGNEIALLHLEIDVAQNVKKLSFCERVNALDAMQSDKWIHHDVYPWPSAIIGSARVARCAGT